MKASKRTLFARTTVLTVLFAGMMLCHAWAGGPICAPPPCQPPMCGVQPCCPPPVCGPRMCVPRPNCPPAACEDDPLSMIVKGTLRLVAGVAALPFKIVGCLFSDPCAKPGCYPMRPACPPVAMCPPPCMPPCPPPSCGMGFCPAGMGYGMGLMPMPMGYGQQRAPRTMMKPMAKGEKKSLPQQLLAGPADGLFGAYW